VKVLETIARGNGTHFSAKLLDATRADKSVAAAADSEGLSDLFTSRYLATITLGLSVKKIPTFVILISNESHKNIFFKSFANVTQVPMLFTTNAAVTCANLVICLSCA
jgi:hypothetical protein